jgi:glycosyltransferase involved in cell wall biosynthesis
MQIAIYHELTSGGAKRATYEIVRRLARAHTVDVYTVSSADLDYCDLRPIVRRHTIAPFQPLPLLSSPLGRLNQLQRWRDLRRLETIARQTAAKIDRQGYSVVYVQPSQYTQAPNVLNYLTTPTVYQANEPLRAAYEARLPRPYYRGGWRARLDRVDPLLYLYHARRQAVDQRNTRRATQLLANSKFTSANLKRIYGREVAVSYPGVDLETFRPAGQPARRNFVLSVGALRPNKGFDFLITALGQLPASERPPLRLVGNADDRLERAYLSDLARQAGVALSIETNLPQADLVRCYQTAALVVYAPISEPLGFVPLEAAACGTPTVGVAEGGVRETIVHGQTGILTPRDAKQFAAAVRALLIDTAQREALGSHGQAWVAAQWTWDSTMASVTNALAQAQQGSHI